MNNESVTPLAPQIQRTERNMGIDLLRIVSMLMVVCLHVLGQGGVLNGISKTDATLAYSVAWFLEIASYCAVNCYAMISGYVGFRSKPKYSNIAILWLQVVFYGVLFALLYYVFSPESITSNSFWAAVLPVTKRAYWYFTAYFCLFFFLPAINHLINTLPKKQAKGTFISIILLFSMLYTLARTNYIGNAVDDLLVTNKGYSALWLALVYFIGGYIGKYREDFKLAPSLCVGIYFGAVVLTLLEKLLAQKSVLVGYTTPTIVACSIVLILLFSSLKCNRGKRVIAFLSPLTFGVYLIHVNPLVWVNFMKDRFVDYASYPAWKMVLAVLGTVIVIFVICSAIELVRHYLFKLLHIKQSLTALEKRLTSKDGEANN